MPATTMAIVSAVPGALGKRLEELRRRLDPDASGVLPPHIPIVGPFEAAPSFLPLEQHIWKVCHDTAPIEVELGELVLDDLARLPLQRGGEPLARLREALLAVKYAPRGNGGPYQPLVVVGRVADKDHDAVERWRQAPVEHAYLLERVELMAQYPDGTWYRRDFYTLDKEAFA